MTAGDDKPSIDRTSHVDWGRMERDGMSTTSPLSDGAALAAADKQPAFSLDARMAHELVSLFLAIDDQDTRERCLAFVREQAEGV